MSLLTCEGIAVLRARITMPRTGAWVADLVLDAVRAPTGRVTLATFDGGLTLVGTVERGGAYADTAQVRVVGGAGGLSRDVAPKAYRALPAQVPLSETLRDVGETLSPDASPQVLATVLPMWTRDQTSASRALTMLADACEATWRVLPDGAVWVGDDTWPAAAEGAYDVLRESPSEGRMVLGVEAPRLLPGTTYDGRRISVVIHTIDDEGVRSELWFEREAEGPRLVGGLRRLLAKLLWRVDFLALYPAKVVTQNSDGTLEAKPDSLRLPGLSRVPIRAGLPGVDIKVAAGARVLIGFAEGDPARPLALIWGEPGMTELHIGGERPVARQGDQVVLTMPSVVPITGVVTGPSGPMPFTGTIQIPTPLIGAILTGSGRLKA